MKSFHAGQLVTVTDDDGRMDAIVFDTPSLTKLVVAVPDDEHGAAFRTVHLKKVTAREDDGPSDETMRELIRRSRSRDGSPGAGAGPGRRGGHAGAQAHRSAGRGG